MLTKAKVDKSRKIYKKYETWIFGFMWTAPEKKKSYILNNVKKLISSEFLFPMTSARGKILWITRKHSCTLMLTNQQQTSLKSWNTSWNSLPLTFSQTALLFNNRVQKFSNISIVDVFSLTDKFWIVDVYTIPHDIRNSVNENRVDWWNYPPDVNKNKKLETTHRSTVREVWKNFSHFLTNLLFYYDYHYRWLT